MAAVTHRCDFCATELALPAEQARAHLSHAGCEGVLVPFAHLRRQEERRPGARYLTRRERASLQRMLEEIGHPEQSATAMIALHALAHARYLQRLEDLARLALSPAGSSHDREQRLERLRLMLREIERMEPDVLPPLDD